MSMSQYSTIKASFNYQSEGQCKSMLKYLDSHGYTTSSSKLTSDIFCYHNTDEDQWVLVIPTGGYQNLNRHVDELQEKASSWKYIETTADGEFKGYISTSDERTEFDLEEWVTNHSNELMDSRPNKEDYETEDDWFEDYTDWQMEVENHFRGYMSGYLGLVHTNI